MKRSLLVIFLLIVVVGNTGCWNMKELNEIAIIVGMGIDKAGDQFEISLQIINPTQIAPQKGNGDKTPVVLYSEKANSIFEALRKLTKKLPRKANVSQLQMLVIGEELAREGIGPVVDLISRDHEYGSNFYITIAKANTAKNILSILSALEESPSEHLNASLKTSQQNWAPTRAIIIDELLRDLISESRNAELTGIEVVRRYSGSGDSDKNVKRIKPDVMFKYSTLAVFQMDKLVGWLTEDESKGVNYVAGKVKSTVSALPCPNNPNQQAVMEVIRTKSKIKGKVQNQQPKIRVDLFVEQNVGELQCENLDLTDPAVIRYFNRTAEKELSNGIRHSIKTLQQKYQTDILGFGDAIRRADPNYWKSIKASWPEKFAKVPVQIHVQVKTLRVGTVTDSLPAQLKGGGK